MTRQGAGSAPPADADDVDVAERWAPAAARPGIGTADDAAGPIGIRCLACGSANLDASDHPRGDEPVRCRHCGEWNTYRALEVAAVEAVRRELARRLGG